MALELLGLDDEVHKEISYILEAGEIFNGGVEAAWFVMGVKFFVDDLDVEAQAIDGGRVVGDADWFGHDG
ncbi:MAG: hypothetical protein KDE54_15560 [Caldilineaceae bacterium]|nr:hypothetical protein [Caldilineaceae bacterium]